MTLLLVLFSGTASFCAGYVVGQLYPLKERKVYLERQELLRLEKGHFDAPPRAPRV